AAEPVEFDLLEADLGVGRQHPGAEPGRAASGPVPLEENRPATGTHQLPPDRQPDDAASHDDDGMLFHGNALLQNDPTTSRRTYEAQTGTQNALLGKSCRLPAVGRESRNRQLVASSPPKPMFDTLIVGAGLAGA